MIGDVYTIVVKKPLEVTHIQHKTLVNVIKII